jgi:micrococcal nuclease
MHFLPTLVLAAVAAAQASVTPTRSDPMLVRAVIDGRTIEVATAGRLRLLGIDVPAIGRGLDTMAPLARQARERLTSLVLNRWVRLELEPPALGVSYRRAVYVMREDGLFVNAVLVREGLARLSARPPLARLVELQKAEREAQAFHRGMWGQMPRPLPESDARKRPKVASKARGRYTAKSGTSQKSRPSRPGRVR